jgi:tRNA(Ile)-lysidine synthase
VSARAGFDSLPVAVQRKALQQQLTGMGLDSDFELVEQLRKSPNSGISVSVGMTVCRDEGGKLHCRQAISPRFQPGELRVDCSGAAGAVKFGGETFYWRIKPAGAPSAKPPRQKSSPMQSEYFDADKIGGKIILRHWRPGDRFHPIGMKAGVKLQDLFVNAKIPAARRRELVLACTEAGEIFWVQGLRIGEPFKLTHQTRRRLQWRHVPP